MGGEGGEGCGASGVWEHKTACPPPSSLFASLLTAWPIPSLLLTSCAHRPASLPNDSSMPIFLEEQGTCTATTSRTLLNSSLSTKKCLVQGGKGVRNV